MGSCDSVIVLKIVIRLLYGKFVDILRKERDIMKHSEFLKLYWKQYISLERDLINMSDYVDIDSKNYGCFSNNFAKIFMMACSELDSLAEVFASIVKKDRSENGKMPITFPQKINMLLYEYPNLSNKRVSTRKSVCNLNFVPFSNFKENEAGDWWKDYNLVKHNRTESKSEGKYNYEKANLKNTMMSLAALFLLCCLISEYIDEKAKLEPDSCLFYYEG